VTISTYPESPPKHEIHSAGLDSKIKGDNREITAGDNRTHTQSLEITGHPPISGRRISAQIIAR
jgi:hypothetical protein